MPYLSTLPLRSLYTDPLSKVEAPNVIRRLLKPAAVAAAFLMAIAAPASTARVTGQARTPGVVAISNATLVTVTKGTIPTETTAQRLVNIAALGANVNIPARAEVIDGTV